MPDMFCTYYQSPIGIIKISGTENLINEVKFVDNEDDLVAANHHPLLHQCVEQLIEYFNGERRSFDLPVYQHGTSFQQSVWNELLNIRFGKTISYLELARRLGDPKCIRAAANSNGKNQVCIIIPCHRIIGSNQSLVGYAWGVWRKKWLLDHELKIEHGVQTLF